MMDDGPRDGDPTGSDLTDEDRAVLPADTPLRRLIEDRRVRIALIAGIPAVVAILAAAAILAHGFGIARSVLVEGPAVLVPGDPTAVRIGYAEMDDFGLPHRVPIDRVRLELCPTSGGDAPCTLLGETADGGRGRDVELHLQVPVVTPGAWHLRIALAGGGKDVRYRFPVTLDPDGRVEPARRRNGRLPTTRLGDSGVRIDIVPLHGGILRGRRSEVVVRARAADGNPWPGTLYLLPIGEMALGGLPESIATDALGLAPLAVRTESFEIRLAISAAPFPAGMDPLEVEVGLLPEDVLDRAALIETAIDPALGPLRVAGVADGDGDEPFLLAGGPLFVGFERGARPRDAVFGEVFRLGRLVRVGNAPETEPPLGFPGFALPEGMLFVQVHGPGEPSDSIVGRHVWAGRTAGPTAAELAGVIAALAWPAEDQAWVAAVRDRLDELDPETAGRLGRYVLGRRDAIWYPTATLFDSRPGDAARAARVREGIKSTMAWGIGGLAAVLAGIAAFVGFATVQHVRRQRGLGTIVPSTAAVEGEARLSMYDRASWWDQHAVLIRGAVVFAIVALMLGAIALLVWGMKQMYMQP